MWMRRRMRMMTAGMLLGAANVASAQIVVTPAQPSKTPIGAPTPVRQMNEAPRGPQSTFVMQQQPMGNGVVASPMASMPVEGGCAPRVCDAAPVGTKCATGFCDKCDPAVPFGAALGCNMQMQYMNGVAARMTLYDYDFCEGTEQLNYRGYDRLRQIAKMMQCNPFAVVIERLPCCPDLADARRMSVLKVLAQLGPFDADRVVVGVPIAIPQNGVEAQIIYSNRLNQTLNLGIPTRGGQSGGGGSNQNSGSNNNNNSNNNSTSSVNVNQMIGR